MPLVQVLEAIGRQIGATLHYSVLPQGVVTATCVGTTLKEVLECLLNRKAGLIVRYSRNAVKSDSKGHVDDFWILGSRLDGTVHPGPECVAANDSGSFSLRQNGPQGNAEIDQTGDLLNQAKSESPEVRAEAIGALLAAGRPGDPEVKAALALLQQAVNDSDETVRSLAALKLED